MNPDTLHDLRIAAPCTASWEGMAGDDRVRHCTLCSLDVYNFAEMTQSEVRELLARSEGRVCARLYRRSDGTVITRDCPSGLRALRRRASRAATALIAALLALPSLAFAGTTSKKARLKTRGARVELEIQQLANPQPAVLRGIVRDMAGPIPGVTVVVRDEATRVQRSTVTDVHGVFRVDSLHDGLYRVEVTLSGFTPSTIEHLQLKASEVTHASIVLRMDHLVVVETITLGAIAPAVDSTSSGSTTTVSEDFFRKMPH